MDVLRAAPSGFLEIADDNCLAAPSLRSDEDALGELERGAVPRGVGADAGGVDGCVEAHSIRSGAHVLFRVSAKEHERAAVVAAQRADGLVRRVARALPVVAEAHAGRLIEHDDDFARAARDGGGRGSLPQERTRERCHDHENRGRAHHQQQPVTDAPAAHRLIRNAPDEHQRGELDDALAFPLDQMNEYRNRQRGKAEEECGSEE